jgi:tRNA(Ile)-lysidine synthase
MAAAGGLKPEHEAILAAARFPDAPLLLALGGGADSAVLAWAAVQSGRPARAATVDHGLADSPLLIDAARALAARLGIEHRLLPTAKGAASEAALRIARYAALEAAARPGEVIATGHTRDDQAETVLGNLLRGAGAGGLAGIPERRGPWCRPLLGTGRGQLRSVAEELHLPFADDPGNADLGRRRNVLRHEVLPFLEERMGPGVGPALARAAALLEADDAALEPRAAAVPVRITEEGVLVPAAALATLPPPVAGRLARRALRRLLDPYPGHTADVAALLAAAESPEGARPLQGGYLAERVGPWVLLRAAAPAPRRPPVPLPVPGEAAFGPWLLAAAAPAPAGGPAPVGRHSALIDATAAAGGLLVRAAMPGDRVEAAAGRKPVAEALAEAGVPAARRRSWPVVASGGRIAWVPGARVAAWAAPRGPEVVRLSVREAR